MAPGQPRATTRSRQTVTPMPMQPCTRREYGFHFFLSRQIPLLMIAVCCTAYAHGRPRVFEQRAAATPELMARLGAGRRERRATKLGKKKRAEDARAMMTAAARFSPTPSAR